MLEISSIVGIFMIGTRAKQTVRADGSTVRTLIDGVTVRESVTHQDHRGTLCEIYMPGWHYDTIPLVSAYLVTVRPGQIKGWAVHERQIDRYFFVSGTLRLVLYDSRDQSPTFGHVNEFVFSEFNRSLVSAPPGIYHAVQNIGSIEGLMFNLPSEPYNYEKPDKLTLPIDSDLIPYKF
jgi:dTDP-4-dehydrorhamnose 3,5-epimerase